MIDKLNAYYDVIIVKVGWGDEGTVMDIDFGEVLREYLERKKEKSKETRRNFHKKNRA